MEATENATQNATEVVGIGLDLTPEYLFVREAPDISDPGLAAIRREAAEHLETTLTATRSATGALSRNPELTAQGRAVRAERIRELAVEQVGKLGSAERRLERAVELSERMMEPHHLFRLEREPPNAAQLEGEVRQRFLSLDRDAARALYEDACRAGDVLTVRAIAAIPPTFQRVSEEALRSGLEVLASVRFPEPYAKLEQERATLRSLRGDVRRALRELGHAPDAVLEGLERT